MLGLTCVFIITSNTIFSRVVRWSLALADALIILKQQRKMRDFFFNLRITWLRETIMNPWE